MLAGLLSGGELQHPQRLGAALPQAGERIERQLPAGGAGGEEIQLLKLLRWHGAQQRIDRCHRLADAGGRLGQQYLTCARSPPHRCCQRTLPGAKLGVREG